MALPDYQGFMLPLLELAGDEFESAKDVEALAIEDEEQLINRVMNIAYSLKQEIDTLW